MRGLSRQQSSAQGVQDGGVYAVIDFVGSDAIAELPDDMRRRAKAGDRLKVVFDEKEAEVRTFHQGQPVPSGGAVIPEIAKKGILKSVSKRDQHEDEAPDGEKGAAIPRKRSSKA